MNRVVILLFGLRLLWAGPAAAQSAGQFELGVQLPVAVSGEFEQTDVGVGGRLSWHPASLVGIEAELNVYPADLPDQTAFSSGRTEGLFGMTLGPTFDHFRAFARLRPGFLRFREAPGPIACILIYPPQLTCVMAPGRTVLALDIGGGVEVFATRKTFVRVDAGDRLLKYPGPAFDRHRAVRNEAFISHDFRFAIGGGLRY